MDLEGFVRRRIIKGYDKKKIIAELRRTKRRCLGNIESIGKKLFYDGLEKTVNGNVLKMLNELNIDYLRISTESLLFIVPEEHAEELKKYLKRITKIYEVGYVDKMKSLR